VPSGVLGQKIAIPEHYDPSILFGITRPQHSHSFYGCDLWRAYEVSWLAPSGCPQIAIVELEISVQSPRLVESKSLKLYLGSLNNVVFASHAALCAQITSDLTPVLGMQPKARVLDALPPVCLPGICIDNASQTMEPSDHVDGNILRIIHDRFITETLHSRLLRSLCPVTGQPDWAAVVIAYTGSSIDRASLLRYIVGFRQHHGFHEACVERIFCDTLDHCKPEQLSVMACFTRRGGIDINPWRSTNHGPVPMWRDERQ
jgi:7-cyano-7-deazaguanine reductase